MKRFVRLIEAGSSYPCYLDVDSITGIHVHSTHPDLRSVVTREREQPRVVKGHPDDIFKLMSKGDTND